MISKEQEKKVDDYFISLFKDKDYLLTLDWELFTGRDKENNEINFIVAKHHIINIYLGLQVTMKEDKAFYKYFLAKSPASSLHLTFNEEIELDNIFFILRDKAMKSAHETLCEETLQHLDYME